MVDHKSKTLADKITVIGNLEHIYYHAKKSAGVVEDEDKKEFYLVVAQMAKDFRREYMKRHFPNCPDELWCLVKATETARQRVYESDEGDTEDIAGIDAIWANVMEELTGEDLSDCASCKADKGEEESPIGATHCYKAKALFEDEDTKKGEVYTICTQAFYGGRFTARYEGREGGAILGRYDSKEDFEKSWKIIKDDD